MEHAPPARAEHARPTPPKDVVAVNIAVGVVGARASAIRPNQRPRRTPGVTTPGLIPAKCQRPPQTATARRASSGISTKHHDRHTHTHTETTRLRESRRRTPTTRDTPPPPRVVVVVVVAPRLVEIKAAARAELEHTRELARLEQAERRLDGDFRAAKALDPDAPRPFGSTGLQVVLEHEHRELAVVVVVLFEVFPTRLRPTTTRLAGGGAHADREPRARPDLEPAVSSILVVKRQDPYKTPHLYRTSCQPSPLSPPLPLATRTPFRRTSACGARAATKTRPLRLSTAQSGVRPAAATDGRSSMLT